MKKIVSALAMIAVMFGLSGCAGASAEAPADGAAVARQAKATDYSRKESWLQLPEITKDVDTFYIYSTAYYESSFEEGAPDHAPLDNREMIEGAWGEYLTNASVYEESTNVFVPYYRQAGMRYAGEIRKKTGNIDAAISGIPYDDITAALDYYFENCNQGRPFIIAGHSQGSAMVKYLLKTYFKEHPEYYERMVAAYVIGFSVTKDDLEQYPHLKFATGERDTGVIISWNTEGPKNVKENAPNAVVLPNAISINPLNWKLDETYAPASENLGSFMPNEKARRYEITDIGADAQVVLERGVIVTNARYDHPAAPEFFGPQSFHEDDYTFYYNNLKDNVAKRVAAYRSRSCCGSFGHRPGAILVESISMPPWLEKLEAENAGRVIAGDEAKIRFVVELAEKNVRHETGGPFAAAIFERGTDRLIAVGVNVVVPAKQSWAHAEMTAFAHAQNRLDKGSLKGYVLASSCEPCAMCNGATLWSGVEKLIYGAPRKAAEEIGFDEGYKGLLWRAAFEHRRIQVVGPLLGKEAFAPFELYRQKNGKIY